jgi:hypothetical protein
MREPIEDSERITALELLMTCHGFWRGFAARIVLPNLTVEAVEHAHVFQWKATWRDGSEWNSIHACHSRKDSKATMHKELGERLVDLHAATASP